ncbi:hypothetical protein [Streptomyces sp. NPDC087297]|uniref:hypothetical protein n=1 Tax=Streptomyces sp. NPDC087297 TaxID=3365778 RepID=UPI003802435E
MSDYVIPKAEAGDEWSQDVAPVSPQSTPSFSHVPAGCPPTGETGELDDRDEEVDDGGGDSLRTLLETAVTRRSLDEVADLVTHLERPGQAHDVANQALRAAAVSRPIEDVISLAALLAGEVDPQHQPPSEPQSKPRSQPPPEARPVLHFQPQPHPQLGRETAPGASRVGRKRDSSPAFNRADRRAGVFPVANPSGSSSGRGLRWPVAVALVVSALMCLPRHPSFLVNGGPVPWLLLGWACVGLALGVLVMRRDRAGVWLATIVAGAGLVSIHMLATVLDPNLLRGTAGYLLPWSTGASVLAGSTAAVLAVMALLYRSDRSQSTPDLPVHTVPEAVSALDAPFRWPAS